MSGHRRRVQERKSAQGGLLLLWLRLLGRDLQATRWVLVGRRPLLGGHQPCFTQHLRGLLTEFLHLLSSEGPGTWPERTNGCLPVVSAGAMNRQLRSKSAPALLQGLRGATGRAMKSTSLRAKESKEVLTGHAEQKVTQAAYEHPWHTRPPGSFHCSSIVARRLDISEKGLACCRFSQQWRMK